jgi:hypothetical protein
MMNHRLTAAAALATITASFSLFAVLSGASWLIEGIGAIVLIALAGTLTRAATAPAAVGATIVVLIASIPLLVGFGWPGVIGGLALVAAAGVSATGNRSARGFAMLATYCSFLLIYLNAVFAWADSYIRLIPSRASLTALWRLPALASPQFHSSPPVMATRPVDLVAVAGIGAIAIIVDYVAVRLRRPALAGLPLLLLFSVPVASNLKGFGFGQSIAFALAIAGYLTLLSTDGRQRLRMWGRLVTVRRVAGVEDGGAGPDTRDLAATGRRVGLAAICLAIAIPIALPSSKPHDLFSTDGNGTGGGGGLGSGDLASPLSAIQQDLTEGKARPVLSYTTTAAHPQQQYLAQWVMNYDQADQQWEVADTTHIAQVQRPTLPDVVPGLQAGSPISMVTTTLSYDSLPGEAGIPVPYAPVRITGNDKQISEESGTLIVINDVQQSHMRLTVTSEVDEPTSTDLNDDYQAIPSGLQSAYGTYKGPDAGELRSLATKHTIGATTPFMEAYDLQAWLRSSNFTYTVKPDLPATSNWLVQFLTKYRRGYCEQFAWAFAVLARTLNIPSRIVVGYTAGRENLDGTWQVTTQDAHAWPELFFGGYGWVRFEPTPGGPAGQGTAEAPTYTLGPPPTSSTAPTGPGSTAPPATQPGKTSPTSTVKGCHLRLAICGPNSGAKSGATSGNSSGGFPIGIPIGVVAFLLLASPALGRWLTRRRRWMAASSDAALAQAAWSELHDDLTDYGIDTLPSDSPRMTVVKVADTAGLKPAPREALARVASAVERAQYSLGTLPGARLKTDVTAVRKAVAANAPRSQRLRALLLPPSTLAAVSNALLSAGRATSWLDWSWPTVRQHFRRMAPHRAN